MMPISKVGRRGQLTLPRDIRRALNIQQGDRVAFFYKDDEVIIRPLKKTLRDFRGSVPVSAPQDFDVIRQQVRSNRAQRP